MTQWTFETLDYKQHTGIFYDFECYCQFIVSSGDNHHSMVPENAYVTENNQTERNKLLQNISVLLDYVTEKCLCVNSHSEPELCLCSYCADHQRYSVRMTVHPDNGSLNDPTNKGGVLDNCINMPCTYCNHWIFGADTFHVLLPFTRGNELTPLLIADKLEELRTSWCPHERFRWIVQADFFWLDNYFHYRDQGHIHDHYPILGVGNTEFPHHDQWDQDLFNENDITEPNRNE